MLKTDVFHLTTKHMITSKSIYSPVDQCYAFANESRLSICAFKKQRSSPRDFSHIGFKLQLLCHLPIKISSLSV